VNKTSSLWKLVIYRKTTPSWLRSITRLVPSLGLDIWNWSVNNLLIDVNKKEHQLFLWNSSIIMNIHEYSWIFLNILKYLWKLQKLWTCISLCTQTTITTSGLPFNIRNLYNYLLRMCLQSPHRDKKSSMWLLLMDS